MNSLPKTVTRQRRDCDLNLGPSATESSMLTTRLPSHPVFELGRNKSAESSNFTCWWSSEWRVCVIGATTSEKSEGTSRGVDFAHISFLPLFFFLTPYFSIHLSPYSLPYTLLSLHIHPFNCPLSGTTQVSRYQKGKTNLDFTEARDSGWQWHQLGRVQACTLLQTDNHTSTPLLSIFTGRMPFLPPNQQRQSTPLKFN